MDETVLKLRVIRDFSEITQFLHVFQSYFGLESFDPERFEVELLNPDQNVFIEEILRQLIKKSTYSGFAKKDSLQDILYKAWIKLDFEPRDIFSLENPISNTIEDSSYNTSSMESPRKSFFDLDIFEKIHVIKSFCDNSMNYFENLSRNSIDEEVEMSWKNEPLGIDSKFRIYWLFNETRLYRLEFSKEKSFIKTKPSASRPTSLKATKRKTRTSSSHKNTTTNSKAKPESNGLDSQLKIKNEGIGSRNKLIQEENQTYGSFDNVDRYSTDSIVGNLESNGDIWELVCIGLKDWETFYESIGKSKRKQDKQLFSVFDNGVYDEVTRCIKRRERKNRKVPLASRPRSLRILSRQLAQKVNEEINYYFSSEEDDYPSKKRLNLQPDDDKSKILLEDNIENDYNISNLNDDSRVVTRLRLKTRHYK
ncbi:hypothetical protein BB560_000586 [Smittium megazygosporum]|uniref:WHIM1 domain-containing protein n=1 Tax=Smittium megazygosporum TaxID=133381 RepID=A0A2T9ZK02_9FUNG|nr:hypothetical protein BB560_000586 [Smittium megazygosporum]